MRYTQVVDGEWVAPTPQRGHKMACCDCGLIHRMDFRVRGGKVEFRAFRDARATAVRRRTVRAAAHHKTPMNHARPRKNANDSQRTVAASSQGEDQPT